MAALDLTGYHLTFDDEFNTRSISQAAGATTWGDIRSEWRYDAKSDIGFGHSSFMDPSSGYDPFNVSGGALKITAVPDRTAFGYPGSWESGLVTTQGSFSQTYGYFEVRANFSNQAGAWDAFWMMPDKQVPDPYKAGNWQELDVVEHYGADPKSVYSNIHTTDPQNGVAWQDNRQVYSQMSQPSGYHTYGVNWQADSISFYVDGQLMGKQATPSDMHGPMYLLLDLATNGDADKAGTPISSLIDYVRVYSNDPHNAAVAQQTVSSPDGKDPGLYGAVAATTAATTAVAAPNPPASPAVATTTESAAFAGSGYLAVNGDVAKAGLDALTHYHQFGWKEGRDPSATFDTHLYLMHNPDVKAAGIDPFEHYLQSGQAEGRQSYAAIGAASSITHGSFDPEYYLLANPDVAKAASVVGGDSLAFAYQHYATNGWQEHRNGDAYFDAAYYLAQNPDVAASHVDPLAHYDNFGWKEGRNPSAGFNTKAYLAANPDVAAAHIDPLTHYLQHGADEGRHLS